jgi:hypothetical protein
MNITHLFRPAFWIVVAAFAIQVLAGAGDWLSLQWQARTIDRDLSALAQVAVGDSVAGSAGTIAPASAIARRHGELRHRAGLAAGNDLLPLLARAAPAISALPGGAIRSLRYADGHVVFELQKLDSSQTTLLLRELQRQGLVAIAVPLGNTAANSAANGAANGARLRIGLD